LRPTAALGAPVQNPGTIAPLPLHCKRLILLFAREFYAASRFPFHRLPTFFSSASLVLSAFIGVHLRLKNPSASPRLLRASVVKNLPLLSFGCGYAALRSSALIGGKKAVGISAKKP